MRHRKKRKKTVWEKMMAAKICAQKEMQREDARRLNEIRKVIEEGARKVLPTVKKAVRTAQELNWQLRLLGRARAKLRKLEGQ